MRQLVHANIQFLYEPMQGGGMTLARLILGDQDLVLGEGEAVEFDTELPHWFGSTGPGPTEVLSIFSRPGERMHVRASSRSGRGEH